MRATEHVIVVEVEGLTVSPQQLTESAITIEIEPPASASPVELTERQIIIEIDG